jgi:hypothetical protein
MNDSLWSRVEHCWLIYMADVVVVVVFRHEGCVQVVKRLLDFALQDWIWDITSSAFGIMLTQAKYPLKSSAFLWGVIALCVLADGEFLLRRYMFLVGPDHFARESWTFSKYCWRFSLIKFLVSCVNFCSSSQLAFLTMTNIRHFWVASNFHYPMQTIKTMWKAIFQNKLTIYKANLPSFVQKNYKKSLLCGLIAQTSAEMPPKNGGVRKANWQL